LATVSENSSTITIKWNRLCNISTEIREYLGYSVRYKIHDTDENFTEGAIFNLGSNVSVSIKKLNHNTIYDIMLIPFKRHGTSVEYTNDFQTQIVKTKCGGKVIGNGFVNINFKHSLVNQIRKCMDDK